MQRITMALLALAMLAFACKPADKQDVDPIDGTPTNPTNPPTGNRIPAELVGKWSYGTFSPTNFWDYNGTYAGNAYEQALVFDFHADGTYEQYVINSSMAYNCRTEAYTYFKGTVSVDAANSSLTIKPTSGNYRGFYSCAPKSNINRAARSNELVQERFNYQVEASKTAIKLSDSDAPQGVRLKATSW